MTAFYFIGVYGYIFGMFALAWALEPKKKTNNTGVRL